MLNTEESRKGAMACMDMLLGMAETGGMADTAGKHGGKMKMRQ